MPQNAELRLPGIEPGSEPWEGSMITITLQALASTEGGRYAPPKKKKGPKNKKAIPGGTRTPNLLIRSQTPCPIGPQGR